MNELEILYEDQDILLCRKPAGIAVQTKRLGQQDMESLLKNYRAKKGETPYIGIVHRLDQPVEGLMVFAKNQKAAASLSKQIQKHMIGKHYYAISKEAPVPREKTLEHYLLTDKKTNVTKVVGDSFGDKTKVPKEAKLAKLDYKVLEEKEGLMFFDIKLHTGRQHQIRVQLSHMGCPLVGDLKYGQDKSEEGLALCSYKLEFQHPATGKHMEFEIQPQGKSFQSFF